MNALILNEDQVAEAQLLSEGRTNVLSPVKLDEGRFILNADLLTDCAPGQTWAFAGDFLRSLPIEDVELA